MTESASRGNSHPGSHQCQAKLNAKVPQTLTGNLVKELTFSRSRLSLRAGAVERCGRRQPHVINPHGHILQARAEERNLEDIVTGHSCVGYGCRLPIAERRGHKARAEGPGTIVAGEGVDIAVYSVTREPVVDRHIVHGPSYSVQSLSDRDGAGSAGHGAKARVTSRAGRERCLDVRVV